MQNRPSRYTVKKYRYNKIFIIFNFVLYILINMSKMMYCHFTVNIQTRDNKNAFECPHMNMVFGISMV